MYYQDEDSDYGLEYSDSEESVLDIDVNLENQYYLAKSLKNNGSELALDAFQMVLDFQAQVKGTWGFKSLKQMIKIYYHLGNYEVMMEKYEELLTYLNSAVTKNQAEKSLNSILDMTTSLKNVQLLKKMYETTLVSLQKNKNDRLWRKTNLKLGKMYLENEEFFKLATLIKQLKRMVDPDQEHLENIKFMPSEMLEIYALEIQMLTELKKYKDVQKIYDNCFRIQSAVAHPLIISVIKECGAKMYLKAGEYAKAFTNFFEAFKNFAEASSSRKYICLKYLLLTSMLMKSEIDPFDSPELKPYKNNEKLKSMIDLNTAYQTDNMKQFEKVFQRNKQSFIEDEFIAEHLGRLLQDVRTAILLTLVQPYTKIKLSFISHELGINLDETEQLIITCILEGVIVGKIDQINNVLVVMKDQNDKLNKKYTAIDGWIFNLDKIFSNPFFLEF